MNIIWALATVVIKELYRRKDFYVLFVLCALITLAAGSVNFFNDSSMVRYLKDLCLLLIWLATLVIAVMTTARQIPAERENRTIFPLLAKPVSRAQLMAGKFLGCWLASGLALLVFYVFFVLVTAPREPDWQLAAYAKALVLQWLMLGIVVAMTLLGSVTFSAVSANVTICLVVVFGILFVGEHLAKIAIRQTEPVSSILYAIYFGLPHLELFDVRQQVVNSQVMPRLGDCALAGLYAAVYMGLILLVACFVFRRQRLNT